MGKKVLRIVLFFSYFLISWSAYRFFTSFGWLEDELIFKPVLWLLPVLFLVFQVEKRDLRSLGLNFKRPLKRIILGIAISLFIWGEYLLALLIKKTPLKFNPQGIAGFLWPLYLLSCLATGTIEEITFRGWFMTRINQVLNDKLWSNILAGFLFFIIHLPILIFDQGVNASGIVEFFVLSLSLGIIDGYVFWKTKGILAPIIAHSSLNFFSLIIG